MSMEYRINELNQRPTDLSNQDLYLTLQVRNSNTFGVIDASYSEVRSQPLLPLPSNRYKVALTNMSVPMKNVALNVFPSPAVFTNPESYSVTLALYDNSLAPSNPRISRKTLGPVPYNLQDPSNDTTIYIYNQYVISINNALTIAFNTIKSSIVGYAANTDYPQYPPQIVCETESSLFYIVSDFRVNVDSLNPNATIDPTTIDTGISPNQICMQISFNHNLASLFYQFPSVDIGPNLPDPVDGRSVILRVYDQGFSSGNDTLLYYNTDSHEYTSMKPLPGSTVAVNQLPFMYKTYQQTSTTNLLNKVDSIVVIASLLDISPTYINVPLGDNGNTSSIPPSVGSSTPIKFLHPPIPLNVNSYQNSEINGQFVWFEEGDFRWNDITSSVPFNRLDFVINTINRDGSLAAITIDPGDDAYITLLFRLK